MLFSRDGITTVSEYFVMDWAAVFQDILLDLLFAGTFATWVPKPWREAIVFIHNPTLPFILRP